VFKQKYGDKEDYWKQLYLDNKDYSFSSGVVINAPQYKNNIESFEVILSEFNPDLVCVIDND